MAHDASAFHGHSAMRVIRLRLAVPSGERRRRAGAPASCRATPAVETRPTVHSCSGFLTVNGMTPGCSRAAHAFTAAEPRPPEQYDLGRARRLYDSQEFPHGWCD